MRVPTNSNTDLMVQRINDINERQVRLQNQVATGQKLFNPEDDAAAFGRVLTLNNEKAQITQFSNNTDYALDLSNATFSGITQIKRISDRAGELATLGAGAISAESATAYGSEVDQLIQQALQVSNSKLRNDYLFAGKALATAPFSINTAVTPNVAAYNGDASQVEVPIALNATLTPGTSGAQNQQIATFLNNLISLRDALNANNRTALSTTVRPALEASENEMVSLISSQGAVQMRIQIVKTQNAERSDNLAELLSNEVDVDMPTAISQMNQSTLAYQAALQSTSQIMKISLLDYLR